MNKITKDEALKLALEAIEEALAHAPTEREQPAPAPEVREQQAPVEWRNAALRVGEELCSVGPFGYYDMTAEQWLDWALSVVYLFHAPPANANAGKPWVGLSTDEIYDMYNEPRSDAEMVEFARAIESKLKEKNGF